jgi:hypothetical protein
MNQRFEQAPQTPGPDQALETFFSSNNGDIGTELLMLSMNHEFTDIYNSLIKHHPTGQSFEGVTTFIYNGVTSLTQYISLLIPFIKKSFYYITASKSNFEYLLKQNPNGLQKALDQCFAENSLHTLQTTIHILNSIFFSPSGYFERSGSVETVKSTIQNYLENNPELPYTYILQLQNLLSADNTKPQKRLTKTHKSKILTTDPETGELLLDLKPLDPENYTLSQNQSKEEAFSKSIFPVLMYDSFRNILEKELSFSYESLELFELINLARLLSTAPESVITELKSLIAMYGEYILHTLFFFEDTASQIDYINKLSIQENNEKTKASLEMLSNITGSISLLRSHIIESGTPTDILKRIYERANLLLTRSLGETTDIQEQKLETFNSELLLIKSIYQSTGSIEIFKNNIHITPCSELSQELRDNHIQLYQKTWGESIESFDKKFSPASVSGKLHNPDCKYLYYTQENNSPEFMMILENNPDGSVYASGFLIKDGEFKSRDIAKAAILALFSLYSEKTITLETSPKNTPIYSIFTELEQQGKIDIGPEQLNGYCMITRQQNSPISHQTIL